MKARSSLSFGTLATPLAKAQTQEIITRLQAEHPRSTCQMTIVPSPISPEEQGDEPFLAASSAEVEFLETQLLAGEFRLVVQRAPDLILPLHEGLTYAAIPERNTPYDSLLNRKGLIADELPDGARVGVLNLRTKAQMQALFPRLNIQTLSGGADSALEVLLRRCQVDALVLPAAVSEHLGIQGIVTEIFYPELMLPSSGQGILVILAKEEDKAAIDMMRAVHSEATFLEMEAEHAFMQRFATDQDLPLSALAQVERRRIRIEGAISSLRAATLNRASHEGPAASAVQIGTELAEKLLLSGDAVIDLLEADFPDGLPPADLDDTLAGDLPDDLEGGFDGDLDGELGGDLDSDLEANIADDLPDAGLKEDPTEGG